MADIFGAAASLVGKMIDIPVAFGLQSRENTMAQEREQDARKENYLYNEQAAQKADQRTRALYRDLYSPQAQLEQIKAAGLSPSLFYGDGGGISGQAGAQGAGASGISPNVFGINEGFNLAELGKLIAETDLIRSQTKKTEAETTQTDLENAVKELENTVYKQEYELVTTPMYKEDGSPSSIYQTAVESNSYEEFVNKVRKAATNSGRSDIEQYSQTEKGQENLRKIYESKYEFDRNISVLSAEDVDAQFTKSVAQALQKVDYANTNAESVIQELKRDIETNTLDGRQKEAFNNLIKKLEKSGSTTSDIVITMLLIINNALSNYHLPSSRTTNVTNNRVYN